MKLTRSTGIQSPGTFLMERKPEYSEKYDSVPLLRSSSFGCTGFTSSMPCSATAQQPLRTHSLFRRAVHKLSGFGVRGPSKSSHPPPSANLHVPILLWEVNEE